MVQFHFLTGRPGFSIDHEELSQSGGVNSTGKIWEANMPIILWFLGVPLGLIVVLYLLHVF